VTTVESYQWTAVKQRADIPDQGIDVSALRSNLHALLDYL
jgi:hypothetical protein